MKARKLLCLLPGTSLVVAGVIVGTGVGNLPRPVALAEVSPRRTRLPLSSPFLPDSLGAVSFQKDFVALGSSSKAVLGACEVSLLLGVRTRWYGGCPLEKCHGTRASAGHDYVAVGASLIV